MHSAAIPAPVVSSDDPIVGAGESRGPGEITANSRSLGLAVLAVVTIALASIVTNTYQLGVSDHDDEIPVIQHILDPSLFKNDWFVQLSTKLNPRMIFDWLMAGLSWLLGIDGAYLLLYVLCTVGLALGIFFLSRLLSPSVAIGAGVIAATIALFNREGSLGSSQLVTTLFVPASLAFTIVVLSAYLLLSGRYYFAALLIAVTGALHALIGPEAGGLFVFALLMSTRGAERSRLFRALPALLAAVSVGLLLGYFMKTGNSTPIDQSELMYLYAWQRQPWHQLPASWPLDSWLAFGGFMAIVAAARFRAGRVLFLDWLIIGVVAFCLLNSVGFIFQPLISVVILQPFRMVVFIQLAGAIYIGRYCWLLVESADLPQRIGAVAVVAALVFDQLADTSHILVVAASVVVAEVVVFLAHKRYIPVRAGSIAWAVATVVVLAQTALVATTQADARYTPLVACCLAVLLLTLLPLATAKYRRVALVGNSVALVAALSVIILAWVAPQSPQPMASVQVHLNYSGAYAQVESWARDNTALDAVFLVPPADDTFRIYAERAVVVDFKAAPFEDADMFDWRQRIYDVAGGKPLALGWSYYEQLVSGFNSLTDDQLLDLGRKYGAGYAVVSIKSKSDLPVVYKNSVWAVRQLQAPQPTR